MRQHQTLQSKDSVGEGQPSMFKRAYLLVSPISYHEADDNSIWLDALWHRDLTAHFEYLSNVIVIAPRLVGADTTNLVRVTVPTEVSLSFVGLPLANSAWESFLQLPRTIAAMLRAIQSSDIVHSGVAGWPYPIGFIANPLAVVLRKPLIVVIESSFWRINEGTRASLRSRARARVTEAFARWSVRRAQLSVFSSIAYRDTLLTSGSGAVLVAPASWIGEKDVLDFHEAEVAWIAKSDPLRLVFAARLTVEKGTRVLLNALKILDERCVTVQVDIIGSGPLWQDCARAAASFKYVQVDMVQPLSYGPEFYSFLRSYHAAIVPTLSDEQPRIIYDAYSQAVPVIASSTGGHRDCVIDNKTGYLVAPGDAIDLANTVQQLTTKISDLQAFGQRALLLAQANTHQEMHRVRAKAIREIFGRMR